MREYIYGAINEETAAVSEDYPWGYRLRTKQRYWIESSTKANGGQRNVRQTLNPKTGRWCKPKKSTYESVLVLFRDDKGHVHSEGLGKYNCKEADAIAFVERHKDKLTDFQLSKIKDIIAIDKVMKHVKFEIVPSPIGPVDLMSNDPVEVAKREAMLKESEERKANDKLVNAKINRAINIERGRL